MSTGHQIGSAASSWIELSAKALSANVRVFRDILSGDDEAESPSSPGGRSLGAVIKGNAYGHGLAEMLPLLHPLVDVIYVIAADDAAAIRRLEAEAGLLPKRLVVLGAAGPEESASLATLGAELVISGGDLGDHLAALRRLGLRLRAHVHVDTGLGREGYAMSDLEKVAEDLGRADDALEIAGVCSHFANVEDVTEQAYAASQLSSFGRAADRLCDLLEKPLERHIAASAAAMVLPGARQDVVRAGISLYGLWPSAETRLSARVVLGDLPRLQPVLSWRCQPQLVKTIAEGSYVGYGCTWRASRSTRIAVLPVGYFDGYPRLVSGKAHVLVDGARCPLIGRVMMNHVVADVTGVSACGPDSIVTLIGSDGGESVTAEVVAGWAQTINYEIVARLGPHLGRVVVDD